MATTFPRTARVLTRAQFQRVFDNNRRSSDGYFAVLVTAPSDQSDTSRSQDRPRVGITVSKRVSKKAVVRNRIKRQVRESFRHCQEGLLPGDYVVIARGRSAEGTTRQLRGSLERHWQRLCTQDGGNQGGTGRKKRGQGDRNSADMGSPGS